MDVYFSITSMLFIGRDRGCTALDVCTEINAFYLTISAPRSHGFFILMLSKSNQLLFCHVIYIVTNIVASQGNTQKVHRERLPKVFGANDLKSDPSFDHPKFHIYNLGILVLQHLNILLC